MSASAEEREIEDILAIAREAEVLVRAIYDTPFEVEMKGPNDPVTRADREANTLICARLAERFPDDAVLAEESFPEDEGEVEKLARRERVFFVDPVDGTREFADRNPEFCVMIGLSVRGRATLGVIVEPITGVALCGRVGASPVAFREDASGVRTPMRVTDERDPAAATMMVSRSHRPRLIEPLTDRLRIGRVVPCGSVGVKVARVATGAADLYVHGGRGAKLWDVCAPEAILVAAGGRFSDLDGRRIDYAAGGLALRNGLVATNGALHGQVVDALREIRAELPPSER
jgi:3'(2'), 5'-bisphosphate nucleotidase